MGTTWPCFNIDSQAEYSWKKTHVVYLMGSAWCRVLWVAQTERDHYWGCLPNTIDEIEPSTQRKTRSLRFRHDKIILLHDNTRPHAAPVKTYLETLKWEVLLHRILQTLLLLITTCSDRWRMACLSSTSHHTKDWRYQKLYRWLDSLKRWSVLPTRYPHATRKMGKSNG